MNKSEAVKIIKDILESAFDKRINFYCHYQGIMF